MSKRNPYTRARKVWDWVVISLSALIVIGALAVFMVVVASYWGWWALLILPGTIAAAFVVNVVRDGVERSRTWWRVRECRWDEKRKQESLRRFNADGENA